MQLVIGINSFSDYKKILDPLVKSSEWQMVFIWTKKVLRDFNNSKIYLSKEEYLFVMGHLALAEKNLARAAKKRSFRSGNTEKDLKEFQNRNISALSAWREILKESSDSNLRLSAIRGSIPLVLEENEIISLFEKGREEVRSMLGIPEKQKKELIAELSFIAGSSLRDIDPDRSLEYLIWACEKIEKATILSVLIWNEMALLHGAESMKLGEIAAERGSHKARYLYAVDKKWELFQKIPQVQDVRSYNINADGTIERWRERYI